MILVVDSDAVMRGCVARVCESTGREVRECDNVIEAMGVIDEVGVAEGGDERGDGGRMKAVELIFLEVMLAGPDGFTFLNELASYPDTGRVPVVLVTELSLGGEDLAAYGVAGVLDKETMRPEEVREYVERY